MIILRAVNVDTSCISVKQNLFKQIMTGDKIFPNSSSCVEVVVFVHHKVL